jgi:hypothetical protein
MKVLGVEVPPAEAEKEPVLDVPAIDMTKAQQEATAAEAATEDVAKPARRSRGRPKPTARRSQRTTKAEASKRRTKADAPKRTRDGSVGRETFEAVEALVRDDKNKSQAFQAIAEKTGRSAATVAANYYRVARASGAMKPRRGRGKATTGPGAKPRSTRRSARSDNSLQPARVSAQDAKGLRDIDRLANELVQSVDELAAVMKAQTREVADLRQRLDGVRSLLE